MAKSDQEKDMERRAGVREAFSDIAKELGWAVKDIRSEIVDSAWFNRDSWPDKKEDFEFTKGLALSDKDQALLGPQDYSVEREDLYGKADWDNVRDIENERARDPLSEARWESHKEQAEALYGRDDDRDMGPDYDIDR